MNSRAITTVIEARGQTIIDWRELIEYRELLAALAIRDIKVRYKQTLLGAAWAILQPLLLMIVFTVIFGRLAKLPSDGHAYPVFIYAGLLAWNLFAQSVNGSSLSVVGAQSLISKVYFPRLVIPLASLGTYLVDFCFSSAVLLAMMIVFDAPITAQLMLLPVLIVIVLLLASALGIWLAALNVRFRDFRYIVPFCLQLSMYVTPVIYPISMIPPAYRWAVYLNPMAGVVDGFRAAFLGGEIPFVGLTFSLVVAVVGFLMAVKYFCRVQRQFADLI